MSVWLLRAIWFAAVIALAGLVSWFFDLNFIVIAALISAALVFNGFLAEWEDNQPGGYNNPKDDFSE